MTLLFLSRRNFAYDADAGKNTVSWNAPAAGVNGGYLDKANIRYTVVRMPDSVTVADNYAQTVFTETTPEAMHNYSYRVYATNNGKRGEYAESERIICGDAFTAPYSQSFADASVLGEFFTVVDATPTTTHGERVLTMTCASTSVPTVSLPATTGSSLRLSASTEA